MTDIRKNCRLTDVKRELIGAMFRYSSQNPRCQDTKKTWESVVSLIPTLWTSNRDKDNNLLDLIIALKHKIVKFGTRT